MFLSPVVKAFPASYPIRILYCPEVIAVPASLPIAIEPSASVEDIDLSVFLPIAILSIRKYFYIFQLSGFLTFILPPKV